MPGVHNRVYTEPDFLIQAGMIPVKQFSEIAEAIGTSRQTAQRLYRKALWKIDRIRKNPRLLDKKRDTGKKYG